MPSDKAKRHGRRNATSDRNRDRALRTRPARKNILIVCEGKETEPSYFRGLIDAHRLHTVAVQRIEVKGVGRQGPALVTYAEGLQKRGADAYDEIWCVFDKDSLSSEEFNNAIAYTKSHRFLRTAWSNEAWELWYVLHFQFLDNAPTHGGRGVARDWYVHRLHSLLQPLGRTYYDKADRKLYEDLGTERRDTAIRHAIRLEKQNAAHGESHHRCVPGTTVHTLVQCLLEMAPENDQTSD